MHMLKPAQTLIFLIAKKPLRLSTCIGNCHFKTFSSGKDSKEPPEKIDKSITVDSNKSTVGPKSTSVSTSSAAPTKAKEVDVGAKEAKQTTDKGSDQPTASGDKEVAEHIVNSNQEIKPSTSQNELLEKIENLKVFQLLSTVVKDVDQMRKDTEKTNKSQLELLQKAVKGTEKTNKSQLTWQKIAVYVGTAGLGFLIYNSLTSWIQQYRIRQKYGNQQLNNPTDFIKETSVEKQLEPFIIKKDNQAVSFLVGVPGTGKTTAIKNIITKLRDKGYEGERWIEAYYITLRSEDDNQKNFDLEERASDLIKLMKAIAADNVGKAVYLVVDDINYLEQIKDQNQRVQTQNLLAILQAPNIHITVVSSSSSYAIDSKKNSPIARRADFSSINLPTSSETKQIFFNVLKRFKLKFQKNNTSKSITKQQQNKILDAASDYLLKIDLPVKEIEFRLRRYRYTEFKSLNKYLQEQIQQFSLEKYTLIADLISEVGLGDKSVENAKVISRLFQLILNCPDQVSMEYYNKIQSQFRYQTGFLSKLQKQAFSIYGKPRHGLYKKIFEQIRSPYKTK